MGCPFQPFLRFYRSRLWNFWVFKFFFGFLFFGGCFVDSLYIHFFVLRRSQYAVLRRMAESSQSLCRKSNAVLRRMRFSDNGGVVFRCGMRKPRRGAEKAESRRFSPRRETFLREERPLWLRRRENGDGLGGGVRAVRPGGGHAAVTISTLDAIKIVTRRSATGEIAAPNPRGCPSSP